MKVIINTLSSADFTDDLFEDIKKIRQCTESLTRLGREDIATMEETAIMELCESIAQIAIRLHFLTADLPGQEKEPI